MNVQIDNFLFALHKPDTIIRKQFHAYHNDMPKRDIRR